MPRQHERQNIDLSWLAGLMGAIDEKNTFANPAQGAITPGEVDPYLNSPENMKKMGNKKPIMPEDAIAKYGTNNPFVGGNYANRLNNQAALDKYQQENQYSLANKYKAEDEARQQQAALAEEQRKLAEVGKTAIGLVPVLATKLGIPASELYGQLGQDYAQAGRNQQYLYGNNLSRGALEGQSGAMSSTYKNLNSSLAEQAQMPYAGQIAGEQSRQTLEDLQNTKLQDAILSNKFATLDKPSIDNWIKGDISLSPGSIFSRPAYGIHPAMSGQGEITKVVETPLVQHFGGKDWPTSKMIRQPVTTPGAITTDAPKTDVEGLPTDAGPSDAATPFASPMSNRFGQRRLNAPQTPSLPVFGNVQENVNGVTYNREPFFQDAAHTTIGGYKIRPAGYDITPDMMNTLQTLPQNDSGLRALRLMQMLQQKYGINIGQ